MTCNQIGEHLMDLAAGSAVAPGVEEHLRVCAACATRLKDLRQTMALLEEWQAPEPSPYFDARLRARLREEAARPERSWLAWLRKPAMVMAMVGLMAVGLTLYQTSHHEPVQTVAHVQPGTAVADLQDLEKNHELLANFDLLDEMLEGQGSSTNDINP